MISGNSIHSNGGIGIDLNHNNVTLNDPLDSDAGPNNLQNYPVLTSATTSGGNTTIAGTLNSTPSKPFTLEFFSSPSCDASGFGEGETFLGSTQVTTDAGGIVGFTANLPVSVPLGRVITATATDGNGNTSEFSRCSSPVAQATFSISGRVADAGGNPISGVVITRQGAPRLSRVTDSNGNYAFNNLPGSANYTFVPNKPNFVFAPANLTFTNLSANQTNQNITGTISSTIQGKIQSNINGINSPVSGVTVTLSGAATRTTQTDNNGNYSFASIPGGNYTVTPTRQNFIFTPTAFNLTLGATTQIVNFLAAGTNAPGKIYFRSNSSKLAMINADGSGRTDLNTTTSSRMDISNDGRKLVFADMVIVNSDGSKPVRFNVEATTSAWSPDGSKIAFISAGTNSGRIETINANGTNRAIIYTATGNCRPNLDIDWSPDGSKIVFDSTVNQICAIKSDGTNLQQLTSSGGSFPSVSPDSQKIAYASGSNVMLMNLDGSNQTLFFNAGDVDLQRIKWSPDGQFLAFRKQTGSQTEVVTINVNGTDLHAISTDDFLFNFVWGKDVEVLTETGSNVNASAGAVNVSFSNVTANGTTTITPISPASAGVLPGGYVIGTQAYEITTTASVSPPIQVCFSVPASIAPTQSAFNRLSLMHNENGSLIDRTTSRNFTTRTICATTTSLSPFARCSAS